jgi:Ca-activated chloride channel family protein
MAVDGGLAELKRALDALTEAGSGLAGKLGEFRAGDEITFLPFNYAPPTPAPPPFIIPSSDPGPVLTQIRGSVNSLRAHGRTAIYDALEDAYQILAHQDASAPGRIDSIVLITDGGNDWGRSLGDFLGYYRSRSTHGKPASVYPIAVGEADLIDLQQVASATGGVLVDAKQEPLSALDAIIATIRGYQWPMATASR